MPKHKTLFTPKEARYCEEYLKDFDAAAAARRAGYAVSTKSAASSRGYEVSQRPHIKIELARRMQAISDECGVTVDRIVRELCAIAFANPRSVMSWGPDGVTLRDSSDLTDTEAAAVAEVGEVPLKDGGVAVRLKLQDKLGALNSLAKYKEMFKDGATVNVETPITIVEIHHPPDPELSPAGIKELPSGNGDGNDEG